jgi:hypothetical protein
MKKITSQDWSLIARYLLKEEATQTERVQFDTLMREHPELKQELLLLDQDLSKNNNHSLNFDAEAALQKLHIRFKNEDLI